MQKGASLDSFQTLGLTPDASLAEIKRAYRRLAMAWHPDRNRDPEATERFKAIRAAYDALLARGDPDAAGTDDVGADQGAPTAAAEPPRAPDIRRDLELDLEEGAFGCRRTIHYRRGKPCATCDGTGAAGISRSRLCEACHGSGRIRHRRHGLERCDRCDGRGFFSERICVDCGGSGRDEGEVSLRVSVPAGLLPGDELRLAGQGEPARDGLAAGDLFLSIRFRPHPFLELAGRDLRLTMPVSALAMLAGGILDVPGLKGREALQLEPGPAIERDLRLPHRGYPGRRHGPGGDLVVTLQPIWPRNLDDRQRKLLLQADAALEKRLADCLPELAAWRDRLVAQT